jgi:phospholipid/cholesterol/gamma-HCH transport system ATP-binding protein
MKGPNRTPETKTGGGEAIVEVKNLTAGYDSTTILRDVTFDVRRGEVFVILGGSGCGKSTLLKNLIGLYPLLGGEVLIGGENLATATGDDRLRILRRIGVTYQSGALFGSMTLTENVCLPIEEFTSLHGEARRLMAWMKLKLVGLEQHGNRLPSEVSGGMQKRAAIARAMALDPAVMFLDEPSAGLDPVTSAELDALILRLNGSLGMTFVIVTHELASIYAVADRIIMLEKSAQGIIAEGDPRELRDHSEDVRVRQFFKREVEAAKA